MELTGKERKIVYAAQFDSLAPVREIARRAGVAPHVAQYALAKLRDTKVIRPRAFLNLYAVGFQQYKFYFSLTVEKQKKRADILRGLQEEPSVVWFAELAGEYQYAMAMWSRSAEELALTLERLSKRLDNPFLKKLIVQLVSFSVFKKKHLVGTPAVSKDDMVRIAPVAESPKLDELDYRLLSALYREDLRSQEEVGRAEGLPRSTVTWRLRRLAECGVIAKYLYNVSAVKLGLQVFTLLVEIRGISVAVHQKLMNFCLAHSNVVNVGQTLGAWDYEITVEVAQGQQALQVAEQLAAHCGPDIRDIRAVSVLQYRTSSNLRLQPAGKRSLSAGER